MKELSVGEAEARVAEGAAYLDLRPVRAYLDAHVAGSLSLRYEVGSGMPGRARDCIPLEVPFVLVGLPNHDLVYAAASFRGKGFAVLGALAGGIEAWGNEKGAPASTPIVDEPAAGATVLSVGDPGAPQVEGGVHIPVERLWGRIDEVDVSRPVTVVAGKGVRAALAVGMLERAGASDVSFLLGASGRPARRS